MQNETVNWGKKGIELDVQSDARPIPKAKILSLHIKSTYRAFLNILIPEKVISLLRLVLRNSNLVYSEVQAPEF